MKKIVNSISEYVSEICRLDSQLIRNGCDKNEVLLFRGQPNIDYEIIPSIGRNRKCACDISILDEERNLIEMAKNKMPDIFHGNLSPIELLALLQHHGLQDFWILPKIHWLLCILLVLQKNQKMGK